MNLIFLYPFCRKSTCLISAGSLVFAWTKIQECQKKRCSVVSEHGFRPPCRFPINNVFRLVVVGLTLFCLGEISQRMLMPCSLVRSQPWLNRWGTSIGLFFDSNAKALSHWPSHVIIHINHIISHIYIYIYIPYVYIYMIIYVYIRILLILC